MSRSRDIARILGRTEAENTTNISLGAGGSSSGSGVTNADSIGLFAAAPDSGTLHYAKDKKALYLYDGDEYDRVFSGPNEGLTFDSSLASTTRIQTRFLASADSDTTLRISALPDAEGFPITYSFETSPSSPIQLDSAISIIDSSTSSGGIFHIRPSSKQHPGAFTFRGIATDGVHKIASSTIVTLANSATAVELLVVAGGGGGGMGVAGGGGAGGYRYFASYAVSADSATTITIGAGGAGSTNTNNDGTSGGNSVFGAISATGGGGGGSRESGIGVTGGSGGGAGFNNAGSAAGNAGGYTPVEGYAGGTGYSDTGGGGGGAAAVGAASVSGTGGNGGIGAVTSIITAALANTHSVGEVSGSDVYFAGGGGGGINQSYSTIGDGGTGGGGDGSRTGVGTDATAFTGGGGGGGAYTGSHHAGGAGGSGVVIIRFDEALQTSGTTGSPTTFASGGKTYFIFKSNGTITF